MWGKQGNGKRAALAGIAALAGEFRKLDGSAARPHHSEERYLRVVVPSVNTFITGLLDTDLNVGVLDYSRRDRRDGELHLSVANVDPRHLTVLEAFHSMSIQLEAKPPETPDQRVEVVRRSREFGLDPAKFRRAFEKDEAALKERIAKGREKLPKVAVPSKLATKIAQMCDGMPVRTDIVLNELARAKAALDGREGVTIEDIQEAADISLAHRLGADVFQLLREP